ncbi:MAG TPA: ExeM/NucH family extracellular endonuclease [Nocardioidaceae bacterium]
MPPRNRATTVAVLSTSLAGLIGLAATPATAVAPPDGQVFVNEIHYDNEGTDAGEALEVAAPAGTTLDGWQVVLYNGSGGASYDTRTLSGTVADQQGGYGTVHLTYPVNGIQNGSPDGVALVTPSGEVAQFLSYEGTFAATNGPAAGMTSTSIGVAEGGGTPVGHSLQLTGTGQAYGDFTWASAAPSTFGAPNTDQTFGGGGGGTDPDPEPEPDPCDIETTHEIGEVQGDGASSPLEHRTVTVEGVVVGDFQARGQLGGVYLQDADGDGDAGTSDGIFVHDPDAPDLAEGDVVRVTGQVTEYFGLTEINEVTAIGDCGDADVPAATVLDLPADDATRESVESMLVTFDEPLTATETYTLARYGELVVSADGRLYQPTNDGGDDAAEQALNDMRRLVIDDASTWENPDVVPFSDLDFADGGDVIRLGDTLTGVEGVLSYGHDAWRLQPTAEPTVERTNPRPASPDEVGGDVDVASFNVLNYFTTIDRPGVVTDAGHDPRGADSVEEFERQQAKIVAAINELDADVVGLMEIENDADDEAVDNLVSALNEAAGEQRYAAIDEPDTGGGLFGTDAIKVAMIYQPAAVRPMDVSYTTTDEAFDNARLPLAQRFITRQGGQPFTVVVNHFKSKGCGSATGENADQGDGQGCWNADRVEQAEALLDFLGTLDGENFLVIGDLNSYGEEDPTDVLEAAGYVDLVDANLAEEDQYSYVFSGQTGYLDHAWASPHLARRVTGTDIWHINSDEALFLDYNTEYNPDGFWDASPYRSSDHDPVLVGLTGLAEPARGKSARR